MWFLLIGLGLLVAKLLEFGSIGAWPWWQVGIPFGLAVVWWAWADGTGYTKRKVVEAEAAKRKARTDKQREELGIKVKK